MQRALILFTAFALVVGGCSGDDDAADDAAVDTSDDAGEDEAVEVDIPEVAFRTIVSADGNAMVIVPDDDPTDITVELLDPADYPDFLAGAELAEGTAIYDLGPDGATFDEPVRFFRRIQLANLGDDFDPLDVPLLLTYTTDDDGQPVVAADPSIMRTGDSVWTGASFDHFSPAVTVNTQKTMTTNEIFGQLIKSIKVKPDEPPVEAQPVDLAPEGSDPLFEGVDFPVTYLDGAGSVTAPTFSSSLDVNVANAGEVCLTMRAPDGSWEIPDDVDATTIDALTADAVVSDTAAIEALSVRTAYAQLPQDRGPIGGGVNVSARLLFTGLDNPLGELLDIDIDVSVLVGEDAALAAIAQELGALIDGSMGVPDPGVPDPVSPPAGALLDTPFTLQLEVEHMATSSILRPWLGFSGGPPPMPVDDFFVVSSQAIAPDSFPVTGIGQLEAIDDTVSTGVLIDRYGAWNLAVVYAPDGLDPSASYEIVPDGGVDFLEIDGQRSELPTALFRSESGGMPTDFMVDADEGSIFEGEIFADGFESGDTSAWTAAN